MRHAYLRTLQTPSVAHAQQEAYGRARLIPPEAGAPQPMGPEEAAFIAARDSFYLASVGETGWPYVQHRGGPRGFLRQVGPSTLVFPDYAGNRQLISTGNVAVVNRVSLFLMDYPARERLKILGTCRVMPVAEAPGFAPLPGEPAPERVFVVDVVGYDWNCPKYITPRYTAEEVEEAVRPLRERIAELEARLAGADR